MIIENGIFKGLKIQVIQEKGLRPTKTRIRNSVFDVLFHQIQFTDFVFFDLFAGSGAMGIEAISRGFQKSYFFENHKRIFHSLRENLAKISKKSTIETLFGDAYLRLQKIPKLKNFAKIFYIDAPYTFLYEKELLEYIQKIANSNDFLIIEKDKDISHLLEQQTFTIWKKKKYGKIYIHFMQF